MNNKQSKLFEPVTELKGVGAKTATALASLGINRFGRASCRERV